MSMSDELEATPWLDRYIAYLGTKEDHNNPVVLKFYAEAGHPEIHSTSVAWCAAMMGAMLYETGYKNTGSLAARSYENYGTKLKTPRRGAIAVFARGGLDSGLGHVAVVESVKGDTIICISGNEHDMVSRDPFLISRAIAFRWPVKVTSATAAVAKKPLVKSKIAIAGTAGGLGSAIDVATQSMNKLGDARDAATHAGVMDHITTILTSPRMIFGCVVVLLCVGIVYWRWKDHGNGATQ